MRKFISLLRTYFDMKGFQVQFNVISPEMLKTAQKYPEKYGDLIVKVAGYSARFSSLDKDYKIKSWIAPHLYTTEKDIERLFSALQKAIRTSWD